MATPHVGGGGRDDAQLVARVPRADDFAMSNAILVPGPKHLIDNLIGDTLEKLEHFAEFQSALKSVTAL